MMDYSKLKIASCLKEPFDKDYTDIEDEIIRKCNAIIDREKDIRREITFYKHLIPLIHSEIERLWINNDGSTCPFIDEAKKKFVYENRNLAIYGDVEANEWVREFTKHELPTLRDHHLQEMEKNPSRYPFSELLEANEKEIISLLCNLHILTNITSGEYNEELRVGSVKLQKRANSSSLGKTLTDDQYENNIIDLKPILSKLSLLGDNNDVNYHKPGPYGGILVALRTKHPHLKATVFLHCLKQKFGYKGGRVRIDNIGSTGEDFKYKTLDIISD